MHHTSETHAAANHKARRLADHGGSGTFGGTQAKNIRCKCVLVGRTFLMFQFRPAPPRPCGVPHFFILNRCSWAVLNADWARASLIWPLLADVLSYWC